MIMSEIEELISKSINLNDPKQLLEIMNQKTDLAKKIKERINTLEQEQTPQVSKEEQKSYDVMKPIEKDEESSESIIDMFYEEYKELGDTFTLEQLREVTPSGNKEQFENFIIRLKYESLKAINEVNVYIKMEENPKEEDLKECKKLIEIEKNKLDIINKLAIETEEEISKDEKNKLVLLPRENGSAIVTSELESISSEYYEGFKGLIESIEDGTFKNLKRIRTPNGGETIYEVKDFGIRVMFKWIAPKTYTLISAFIKRNTSGDGKYYERLRTRQKQFVTAKEKLKKSLNDPDFIIQNEENLRILNELLSPKNKKEKKRGEK